MEESNAGILEIRAETTYLNCQKILQTHHSITPLFHYSNWAKPLFHTYFPDLQQVTISTENFGNAVLLQRFHAIFYCLISDDFHR